jgi:acetyl esterase
MKYSALVLIAIVHCLSLQAEGIWEMRPEEVRKVIDERVMAIDAVKQEVYSVEDAWIGADAQKLRVRIYRPSAKNDLPVALMIHGGAWLAGSIETHDNMARYLAVKSGVIIVSVGYTLSPEAKFPLPLEQCYEALGWTVETLRPTQLALVGDSAGGALAAALSRLARDRKGPKIDLQLLINPSTDLSCNGTLTPQGDALDSMRYFVTQYIQKPEDVYSPYVSPLLADEQDSLPRTLIIVAELDRQRQEGELYAERLRRAGVKTNLYIQWGIGHLAGNAARAAKVAEPTLDVAACELRTLFPK